jgi:outer membrane protein assembly factor BamB
MMLKILKWAAVTLLLLVAAGVLLYAVGLRVVLDGGGKPYFAFVDSERARLKKIAANREAQHAPEAPAPAAPERAASAAGAPAAEGATAVLPPVATSAGSTYWTDFRGPARDGEYRERPILTSWPAGGLKPVWREPVGSGYASMVIARGRVFTIEQRGSQEVVAAYDLATGHELWTNAWTAAFREMMGGDGPRATPTWFDGRVYALGGQGEFRCLDEGTGRTIWRANILEDAGADNLRWGMAASPLVVGNTVVVLPGGGSGQSVVAYDRLTGTRAWAALDDQAGYSSPMLVTLAGVRQLVVFSASRVMGLTPDRGGLLWSFPWTTQFGVNASQPVIVGDNRVFISTGYGTGAAMIEIASNGGALAAREVWRTNRMKNQFTTTVFHDGFLYGLDESILACLDAATGDLKWKGGRYGFGQVMLASGHLVVLSEQGDLALVRATPEKHDEIARFPMLEGKTWSHPAMADGYLLIRNVNEMAAFDLRPDRR